MDVSTDYQSSTETVHGYHHSFEENQSVKQQEGRLGGSTICTQPQDRKTLKIMNRVHDNVHGAAEVSKQPEALEIAGSKAKEQITRTRIRNGFTPVPKDIAPESSAIAALRERLLSC